jgi:predicted lipoprotein with Yx(FWY)xxD motif
MRVFMFCLALVLLTCALPAAAAGPALQRKNGLLVDAAGKTLYTFDKDTPGASSCYAQCATLWPPLFAPADAVANGEYTVVTRKGGRKQWALRGKPLYYWLADTKPGDATGESVPGWHLVR